MSSANDRRFNSAELEMSLIKIRNKIGPIVEPCGTPQVISLRDDMCSLTWVYCFRLER